MSDSGYEKKTKRPPVEAAGDDPWAKWRQPEAAPKPAPAEEQRRAPVRPPEAAPEVKAEVPVAPVVRERPVGTLSPNKPAAPAPSAAKKPYKKSSGAASAPRVHQQMRGGKASDARPARAERPAPPPMAPRDPADVPSGVRLSKVMSERGLCSRREADLWIERGWVFVDGEQISELGSRIEPTAEITITKRSEEHTSELQSLSSSRMPSSA